MKAILAASLITLTLNSAAWAQSIYGYGSNPSSHSVQGYTNGNGTYVQPHYQTNPNSTQYRQLWNAGKLQSL